MFTSTVVYAPVSNERPGSVGECFSWFGYVVDFGMSIQAYDIAGSFRSHEVAEDTIDGLQVIFVCSQRVLFLFVKQVVTPVVVALATGCTRPIEMCNMFLSI